MALRIDALRIAPLILAAAVTACQSQTAPGSASIAPAQGGSAPSVAPSIGGVGWMAYKNEAGGFALEIPAGWLVQETVEIGSVRVSFGPPDGGSAITIQVPASAGVGTSDLPNVRCQSIEVGGLPAVRCRDTVSGGDVTAVAAPGRTYEIANLGKRSGDVYEHALASFMLLVPN